MFRTGPASRTAVAAGRWLSSSSSSMDQQLADAWARSAKYAGMLYDKGQIANLCVVGGGRMGHIRATHITRNPRTVLGAFVDVDPDTRAAIGRQYGCLPFSTLSEALEEERGGALRGVWVCTPTRFHKPVIIEAAEAGLHVAVEKPVAMNLQDIDDCYAACQANGVKLHCCFQRRTDPAYQKLASQVREGTVGKLLTVHTVFRDHPCPPIEFLKTGGDPFHDLATHDIDYLLSIAGEEPVEVFASGTSLVPELREAGVMDTASVVLKFPSGLIASMELSRNSSYGYDQRVEVFGSNGSMLAVENMPSSHVVSNTSGGIVRSRLINSFPDRFDEAYRNELDLFVDMIEGKAESPVDAHAARMASLVAEAALQSATKGTMVRLIKGKDVHSDMDAADGELYFEVMERKGEAQDAHTDRQVWPAR